MLPTPLAALFAPVVAHTELTNERIRFDPVPVYIGPGARVEGAGAGRPPDDNRNCGRAGRAQDHIR